MKFNIILFITIVTVTAFATYMMDYATPRITKVIPSATGQNLAGKTVPPFTFTDTNGMTHSIDEYKGKVVFLNFWASWCTPCLVEFPEFIKLAKTHKDNIAIIALSSDFEEAPMTRFLDKMKKEHAPDFPASNFIIALDENAMITQGLFQTHRLPETIIIDKNGKMVEKIVGARWKAEDLDEKINTLTKNP